MAKKIKRVFADTDTYADPLEDKVDSLEAEGDAVSLEDHQKSQDVMVDPEGMISEDMHDSDALVEAAVLLADFDDEDFELGLEDEGEDVSVAVDGAEDEVAEGDEPKARMKLRLRMIKRLSLRKPLLPKPLLMTLKKSKLRKR